MGSPRPEGRHRAGRLAAGRYCLLSDAAAVALPASPSPCPASAGTRWRLPRRSVEYSSPDWLHRYYTSSPLSRVSDASCLPLALLQLWALHSVLPLHIMDARAVLPRRQGHHCVSRELLHARLCRHRRACSRVVCLYPRLGRGVICGYAYPMAIYRAGRTSARARVARPE